MGCYCRRVGAYKGVGCLIDFSSLFRLEAPAGMLGCKRDFVVEAIVGVRVSPEQVQACYQTRLLGVVGTDGGSEFGMSDVRLARDAPGPERTCTPLRGGSQLHPTRAFQLRLVPLALRRSEYACIGRREI